MHNCLLDLRHLNCINVTVFILFIINPTQDPLDFEGKIPKVLFLHPLVAVPFV